jgi:hypothetical protein
MVNASNLKPFKKERKKEKENAPKLNKVGST